MSIQHTGMFLLMPYNNLCLIQVIGLWTVKLMAWWFWINFKAYDSSKFWLVLTFYAVLPLIVCELSWSVLSSAEQNWSEILSRYLKSILIVETLIRTAQYWSAILTLIQELISAEQKFWRWLEHVGEGVKYCKICSVSQRKTTNYIPTLVKSFVIRSPTSSRRKTHANV